jgi:hypothetical protein
MAWPCIWTLQNPSLTWCTQSVPCASKSHACPHNFLALFFCCVHCTRIYFLRPRKDVIMGYVPVKLTQVWPSL